MLFASLPFLWPRDTAVWDGDALDVRLFPRMQTLVSSLSRNQAAGRSGVGGMRADVGKV